ncbi:unnamed protein product [Plutella xylostella]|uniref:(diamondback moth) hypothetical protein n=1 Tax=Plutella xylostella TaxID=51655 RepID=A0A8S4D668_PLUXY|nr:unnamed protein product [Plutella xylostella]
MSLACLSIRSSHHAAAVWAAARWLAAQQRPRGGWPVPARRRVAAGLAELKPGWSAMFPRWERQQYNKIMATSLKRLFNLKLRRARNKVIGQLIQTQIRR